MASSVTETKYVDEAGASGGRVKLYGSATTSGGGTSFVIQPGHNTVNISGSSGASTGLRKMYGWSITNNANSNAFKAVKTFDATNQADILTITCTANDTFDWMVDGECAGA